VASALTAEVTLISRTLVAELQLALLMTIARQIAGVAGVRARRRQALQEGGQREIIVHGTRDGELERHSTHWKAKAEIKDMREN
jgi:hypothetical protein